MVLRAGAGAAQRELDAYHLRSGAHARPRRAVGRAVVVYS